MTKDPTIGMFVGDAEIERRRQRRRGETVSHDTQVKQEAPERVFLKACHPASPNHNCTWSISKEPKDSVEYVRADLLATVRQEAREAAFKEAIQWAQQIHTVKMHAAHDAQSWDEFAAIRLRHEADGVERVIGTLKALKTAATEKK